MSNKQITPEQEKQFPKYVDKWLEIGLSTEPVNVKEVRPEMEKAYRAAKLTPPSLIIKADCPLQAIYIIDVMEYLDEKNPPRQTNEVYLAAMDKIPLDEPDLKKVDKILKKEFPGIDLRKHTLDNLRLCYGNHDASWLSFYDFMKEECGEDLDQLDGLIEIAKKCGWWIPYEEMVIIVDRPRTLKLDDEGRLHNTEGPAIAYRSPLRDMDIYAVHGVNVKKNIIDRNYTWEDIEKEQNVEIRRIMIDLYGQEKYLLDSGAKLKHKDDWGELYEKDFTDDENLMMVKVTNPYAEPDGSFKDFFLRVDPKLYGGIKTARQAVASTWRDDSGNPLFKSEEEYVLDQES